MFVEGGRSGDAFYRDRWSHDKVVRSTHGVNCTGSCSWKIYVKDGIITWEAQQTDYPSTGGDRPEYEPRGCPRGAAFSWYTYSPTRVRYPYVRGTLLQMFREAKERYGDPVVAWGSIVQDPELTRTYKSGRGKGGLVRATWEEVVDMVSAAMSTRSSGGARTASPASPRSPRCRRSATSPAPASTSSSAHRCSPSTTGTPTCPMPRRRCSETRPMSPSRATGGTRPTSSCGAPTSRSPAPPTPTG